MGKIRGEWKSGVEREGGKKNSMPGGERRGCKRGGGASYRPAGNDGHTIKKKTFAIGVLLNRKRSAYMKMKRKKKILGPKRQGGEIKSVVRRSTLELERIVRG